ncbi:Oligoxyloglucan reducing end-specific cellobiohydrolase [Hymenopellis radicata]|nr:Oligoxyloglucan reducing end-specific cellobiohydrolase [Hymenopellis radicata]
MAPTLTRSSPCPDCYCSSCTQGLQTPISTINVQPSKLEPTSQDGSPSLFTYGRVDLIETADLVDLGVARVPLLSHRGLVHHQATFDSDSSSSISSSALRGLGIVGDVLRHDYPLLCRRSQLCLGARLRCIYIQKILDMLYPLRLGWGIRDGTTVFFQNSVCDAGRGKDLKCSTGYSDEDAAMVIELPFDNRYAFVLTRGKRHYRTEDRGKTWRPFEVPLQPSLVSRPLSFHSDPKKFGYILHITPRRPSATSQSFFSPKSGEGYTCNQLFPGENFLAFYHHPYSDDRAYLITSTKTFYSTTDSGRSWNKFFAPNPPTTFRAQLLRFQPDSDKLIWTGNSNCEGGMTSDCHAQAHWSRDNGRKWTIVDKYVVNCAWARDTRLKAYPTEILCESYQKKEGNQRFFLAENPLELVEGLSYYTKKKKLFDQVVGFVIWEFLVVAELMPVRHSLELQVSLDGVNFATGQFPPSLHPETHQWDSIENVNRDHWGYVDFEKMIGLDGIALINVVANTDEAVVTGQKALQTRITHNDGSTWKRLVPPAKDSQGNKYDCDTTSCALHIHGYTERLDPRATYGSPSIVGLLMAVGNVGTSLAPYTQSDTFLSHDAGFTWEEVHKDAHLWEFGNSGSILIMANDEEPTDPVLFSTDEGLNWRVYTFTKDKMRVNSIVTVPSDTSRKFILLAQYPGGACVAKHLRCLWRRGDGESRRVDKILRVPLPVGYAGHYYEHGHDAGRYH